NTIRGRVFHDLDGNGAASAGESAQSGWTVFLDTNGNDSFDPGEPVRVTDANGRYKFANLPAGTYNVRELGPSRWVTRTPPAPAITLLAGPPGPNVVVDIGNFRFMNLSGEVFRDTNGNGMKDGEEEPGLGGWTVFLDLNNDGVSNDGPGTAVTTTVAG